MSPLSEDHPSSNNVLGGQGTLTLLCRTVAQVHANAVETLGLDPSALDLEAPEAIAGLVRRAATFLAPCAPRTLRYAVLRGLVGLAGNSRDFDRDDNTDEPNALPAGESVLGGSSEDGSTEHPAGATGYFEGEASSLSDRVAGIVEALVAYGDLIELPARDDSGGRLLYLAPPTFVRAAPGVVFLLGARPDAVESLPGDMLGRVVHTNHTRRIYDEASEDLPRRLRSFGFIELPGHLWLASPRREVPADLIGRADRALSAAASCGDVAGLTILDPTRTPRYYRGRWVDPGRRSGRFIARRRQRYGADLWAYVEIVNGGVTRLMDLPLDRRVVDGRGCDDAWRIQLAIDAVAGHRQCFRVRTSGPAGAVIVDFFSPIPRWALRKWDVLGEAVAPMRSLLAYRFPVPEFATVRRDLEDDLWLVECTDIR